MFFVRLAVILSILPNIYTNGTSEKFLGEFVASERDALVLATKYTNGLGDGNPQRQWQTSAKA